MKIVWWRESERQLLADSQVCPVIAMLNLSPLCSMGRITSGDWGHEVDVPRQDEMN